MLNDEGFMICPCCKGIKVLDPTAAGDSFVAAFCIGEASGWKMEETLRFANCVAGLTVTRFGAMPSLPALKEVECFMKERNIEIPDVGGLR